jgi:hypothetical protein
MGMRSGTTFKKRQKEIARMEKQRDKAARRVQRKADKLSGESSGNSEDDDLLGVSDEANGPSDEANGPSGEASAAGAGEATPPNEPAPVHE